MCNPTLAQFIVADDFAPVEAPGLFAKSQLDPAHRKRKGTAAIKARKQKRQERKSNKATRAGS